MLVYMCRNCRQFTIKPLINEFEEAFCCEECYKKYCEKHNYVIQLDHLLRIIPR